MTLIEILASACLAVGVFFFFAGTVGLLRFPDVHSRLHALTKADNLGLAFIVLGAGIHFGDVMIAAKLALVWFLAVFAAGAAAQLVARAALRTGDEP
ncbi:monovalent cation/H(+) antiporter subunit G [Glycocaulis profundi]|nr:monovalent cation/H(+) antiporter subunit G [Glycocaulis profundi]